MLFVDHAATSVHGTCNLMVFFTKCFDYARHIAGNRFYRGEETRNSADWFLFNIWEGKYFLRGFFGKRIGTTFSWLDNSGREMSIVFEVNFFRTPNIIFFISITCAIYVPIFKRKIIIFTGDSNYSIRLNYPVSFRNIFSNPSILLQ